VKSKPLVIVAGLFIAGIALSNLLEPDWRIIFAAAWVLLLLAVAVEKGREWILAGLMLVAGAASLSLRTSIISPNDLRRLFGDSSQIITVQGRLAETPYQRVYERRNQESWRTIAFVEVDSVSFGTRTNIPAFGTMAINTTGILASSFTCGQAVEINGVLQVPPGALAEGLFDYGKYLRFLGIHYQVQANSTNDWRVVGVPQPRPVADRFTDWAQGALAYGLPTVDEPVRLLWAMTLGWKTAMTGEVSEPFMRSGTIHVFAISGLHIAFIALIVVNLLRLFAVPRNICAFVVIPLIWAYTGITGWQASAIRSTIMTTVIVAGWLLRRPSDLLNSLGAAALIILVWDPQQLFQPGFQLSFGAVLSLALISPVLTRWKDALLAPDPFLPDELRSRAEKWVRKGAHFLGSAVITSLAAWLGAIPVVAYYFHFLTPSSLVANLLVVPLSSAALASDLGSLAFAGWFPAFAELFNHAAWAFMAWMMRISEWCADLPSGCFNIAAPGIPMFLLYYFVLIAVLAGWFKAGRQRGWCIVATIVLAAVWLVDRNQERAESRLSIVPLHGGEAVYFEDPSSNLRLLIDGGDESAAKTTTKQFLRAQGVNHLSGLLLTHGDVRQNGGAELVRDNFHPQHVYASPLKFRSPVYRRVVSELGREAGLLKNLKRGDKLGPWTILHPDEKDRFKQADDVPLVALGKMEGFTVLLLSDLTASGQNMLLTRYPDLRADIVVSGLPRNSEPVVDPFLQAVRPRLLIITDADYPATAHANRGLRRRLGDKPFETIYTSDSGAVMLHLRKGTWRLDVAKARKVEIAGDGGGVEAGTVEEESVGAEESSEMGGAGVGKAAR